MATLPRRWVETCSFIYFGKENGVAAHDCVEQMQGLVQCVAQDCRKQLQDEDQRGEHGATAPLPRQTYCEDNATT